MEFGKKHALLYNFSCVTDNLMQCVLCNVTYEMLNILLDFTWGMYVMKNPPHI
jgi:hypothetical protein